MIRNATARRKKVEEMVRVLDGLYDGEAWDRTRKPGDPVDSLIRTILSQNTTDENRDRAYEGLRARFPTWDSVLSADPDALQEAIRVAGLARQKGPTIQGVLRWLKSERGALDLEFLRDLPEQEAVAMLTRHRGVGIKTAYIVLAFACNKDLCAVDTHVHRILRRMGIVDESCGREKAHRELGPLIPTGKARGFHVNMLDFGKTVCTARNPGCPDCPLRGLCRYVRSQRP